MEEANIEYEIQTLSILINRERYTLSYFVSIFCLNTENTDEKGYMTFESVDGKKWKCIRRDKTIFNLKLDNIFNDSMITKVVSEEILKLNLN